MTLLDEFFPVHDASERHSTRIAASPAAVFAALRTADLSGHIVTRALLALRALPAWLMRRAKPLAPPASARLTLAAFEQHGFVVLAERVPEELLIGLQGRFWTLTGQLEPLDAVAARRPVPTGRARAGWNFSTQALPGGGTLLSTETRIVCADAATRRRFLWYWRLIQPGSGLIRRAMLSRIKREAERVPAA